MKRVLALLLTLALLVGLVPAVVAAGSRQDQTDAVTTVEAVEVEGVSVLDEVEPSDAEPAETPGYAEDEMVTVIVQLEEPALMDYYGMSTYALGGDEDLTAGEAVSAFLTSDDAQAVSEVLLEEQDAVLDEIGGLQPATFDLRSNVDSEVEVVAQWTKVANAMAIQVPYGLLSTIQQLDGVANAYVQKVYEWPDDELTAADVGNAFYSYNMVDAGAAWAEGYTGEGMLIAVLDTGLDLEWASYWDDSIGEYGANVTGVRRVHEAFQEDSFMTEDGYDNVRYTESSMARFLESTSLVANTGADGNHINLDNNAPYKNRKIPFAVDYADGDMNVRYSSNDHGTHVAGTIAGYAEDGEGAVKFSGIAPDAQLLVMKVFSDTSGGAPEYAIVNALEDAAVLGADVMNLSLGSDCGFAHDDTLANEVYGRLNDAGILFMISAGNSDVSSDGNNYGGNNLASDPDNAMMSAPSVYESALSVASINSSVQSQTMLTWTDTNGTTHEIPYLDTTGVAMKQKFSGVEGLSVNIIPVDGAGTSNDYYNAGFRAYNGGEIGIALVQRGGVNESGDPMSFAEKINNATRFAYFDYSSWQYVYPIQAVIIYDNDPTADTLIYMSGDTMLTSAFIGGRDGAALAEAAKAARNENAYVTLTDVAKEDAIIPWDEAGEMSEFSSWGPGPGLELKPEITAPGGNVWSSLMDLSYNDQKPGYFSDYTGTYGMMSGTSMAAPHMTAITALVMQYARDKDGLNQSGRENVALLTDRLLVSTALPQKDSSGVYYSPRQQGAGLVSVSGAMSTPAYITVDGQNVGKLEFKDDPEKSGTYAFRFDVHNLTDNTLTYNAQVVLLRPAVTADGCMANNDVLLREVSLDQVTVSPRGTVSVNQTVSLTDAEKEELDSLFANGAYVEGYVILTDPNGSNPQIGLPFLAFYGDWTAAPIFDSALWTGEVEEGKTYLDQECTWGVTQISYMDGYSFHNLGENIFAVTTGGIEPTSYEEENITISPTGYMRSINDFVLYQKRSAKMMVVEVRDADTDELYYRDFAVYMLKTNLDSSSNMVVPYSAQIGYFTMNSDWSGTDLEGNVLPNGTRCIFTITAYGEGDYPMTESTIDGYFVTDFEAVVPGETEPTFNGHEMDTTGDVISFPVLVDTEAPTLVNSALTLEKRDDGRIVLSGTFQDEGSLAAVQIYPQVKRSSKYNPDYFEISLDMNNPFYVEYIFDAAAHTWGFEVDVTEYAHAVESYPGESYSYNFEWTGNVFITGGDYGGNERTYAVTVNESNTADGLILSTTSALLYVGDEFDLNVINNTGSGEAIIRTSSNPEVATVDELGHIVALAPGQTTITISCGGTDAFCIVAVRARPTEVTNFNLSLASFDTLKPNGTILLKVTDVEPADVELTTKRWVAWEDEDYAEEVMSGLVAVSQYDSTGLAGDIYLNYSTFTNGVLPGGTGYIEVTLNNLTKRFEFSWDNLWLSNTQDDLVSGLAYNYQTVYVTEGETATLSACYNDASAHSTGDVMLCTVKNYQPNSYDNVLDVAEGLKLDGPDFFPAKGTWSGRLVNQAGYALPESIRVFTRYSYGYEYEMTNSWRTDFTYNSETGEITVYFAPDSETSILMIRADGVPAEGKAAGELSGKTYEKPAARFGPFEWKILSGSGELTQTVETDYYGTEFPVAKYAARDAGVSIIQATDGEYTVNFAVVAEPVMAETLTLDVESRLTMEEGETRQLTAALDPMPTVEKYREVIWTSYNPSVVTVDENGLLKAIAPGYAYVTCQSKWDASVMDYCLVSVNAASIPVRYQVVFNTQGGSRVESQSVAEGATVNRPADPVRRGFTFGGWYVDEACTEAYDFNTPVRNNLVLFAKWEQAEGEDSVLPILPGLIGGGAGSGSSLTKPTEPMRFSDVSANDWFYDAVKYVYDEGLMNGTGDGKFSPYNTLTRAMVVTILYRLEGEPNTRYNGMFPDVPNYQWYTDAVEWAAKNSIVNGYDTGKFGPEDPVTREQLVTILYRYAQSKGYDVSASADLSAYSDGATVSAYAVNAVKWAVAKNLLAASNGKLQPRDAANRAQVAVAMANFHKQYVK